MITRGNDSDYISFTPADSIKRIVNEEEKAIYYKIAMPEVHCANFVDAYTLQEKINKLVMDYSKKFIK